MASEARGFNVRSPFYCLTKCCHVHLYRATLPLTLHRQTLITINIIVFFYIIIIFNYSNYIPIWGTRLSIKFNIISSQPNHLDRLNLKWLVLWFDPHQTLNMLVSIPLITNTLSKSYVFHMHKIRIKCLYIFGWVLALQKSAIGLIQFWNPQLIHWHYFDNRNFVLVHFHTVNIWWIFVHRWFYGIFVYSNLS